MKLPGWAGEVARFGGVGLAAFVLDAGVLWAAVRLGVSPYAGRVFSIAAAIAFTWLLNRSLTFRTAAPPSWREFGAYALVSLTGAGLNYAVYSAVLWAGGGIAPALVLGTGVAAVFNFWRYRSLLGSS